ncbi:MAG: hypothetical protein AAGC58_12795 [Asticcacaulis sp.]
MPPLPATAQAVSADKTHAAYELAIKCFVVNGHAHFDRREAKDLEGASRYEGNAKRAWDIADKLRIKLGYPKERYSADHKRIMDRELPRLYKEPGYYATAAGECKAYGLL